MRREALSLIADDPKRYLRQAMRLEERIKLKMTRIQHLRDMATKITTNLNGVGGHSGVSDKVGNAAAAIATLTDEIGDDIERLRELNIEIGIAIATMIPDETIRAVIEARYLAGTWWEIIAVEMHYSYRWIMRLHKRGLSMMQKAAVEQLGGNI